MRILTAFCCLALLCVSGASRANALEISPTILQFQQDQSHQSVRISNRGKAPIIVQARSFMWEQNGDADTLLASAQIVISPPIFTLQPGTTQTLRVMLRDPDRCEVHAISGCLLTTSRRRLPDKWDHAW